MSTEGLFGADLSTYRIEIARKINPNINYILSKYARIPPSSTGG